MNYKDVDRSEFVAGNISNETAEIRVAFDKKRSEDLDKVEFAVGDAYHKLIDFIQRYPIHDVSTGDLNEPILRMLRVEMMNVASHFAALRGNYDPLKQLLRLQSEGKITSACPSVFLNDYICEVFLDDDAEVRNLRQKIEELRALQAEAEAEIKAEILDSEGFPF